MSLRLQYRPTSLSFDLFHTVDVECFPNDSVDAGAFASAVTQDFWSAWDGKTLAGFAWLQRRGDVFWLSRIGTAAAHRRKGVAGALLGEVLEHCSTQGPRDTMLYVRKDNPTAIRLYERFDFHPVESAWHLVLPEPLERIGGPSSSSVTAVPIVDVPEAALPRLPREWAAIAGMHRPPAVHVFVFQESGRTMGFARLNPGMPGCFPFVIERPTETLGSTLGAIRAWLEPNKRVLKFTVSDPDVADACRRYGMQQAYELLKMMRRGDRRPERGPGAAP